MPLNWRTQLDTIAYVLELMKKVNKQCLLDTPAQ